MVGPEAGRDVSTDPDEVHLLLEVHSVRKLDQQQQELTLSVFEYISWEDPRLVFDTASDADPGGALCVVGAGTPDSTWIALASEDYKGADKILWTPDVYITNQRSSSADGNSLTFVFSTGVVTHVEQKSISTSCPMDFGQYPFDKQSCAVKASTFSQSADEVTLTQGLLGGSSQHLLVFDDELSFATGEFDVMSATSTSSSTDDNFKTIVGTVISSVTPTLSGRRSFYLIFCCTFVSTFHSGLIRLLHLLGLLSVLSLFFRSA